MSYHSFNYGLLEQKKIEEVKNLLLDHLIVDCDLVHRIDLGQLYQNMYNKEIVLSTIYSKIVASMIVKNYFL